VEKKNLSEKKYLKKCIYEKNIQVIGGPYREEGAQGGRGVPLRGERFEVKKNYEKKKLNIFMKKYLSGLKGGGRVPLRGMEVVKNLK